MTLMAALRTKGRPQLVAAALHERVWEGLAPQPGAGAELQPEAAASLRRPQLEAAAIPWVVMP